MIGYVVWDTLSSAVHERRLVCLANVPTPYRIHFYEALARSLGTMGIGFGVMFMAQTEPGRHWTLDASRWSFEYRLVPGIHPLVGGRLFHLNPGALAELTARPPSWLLLSGSWYFPTVFLVSWLAKLTRTVTLFWSESNRAYVEHGSALANRLRGWVMDSFDGYAVPGSWAHEYVNHFAPSASDKPILYLPNVVDESLFKDGVAARRKKREELLAKWQVEEGPRPILFTAVRLEPIKGVKELLLALELVQDVPVTLLVAGEGSLRAELQSIVQRAGLEDRIRLLGYLDELDITDLLALADAFILPSLGDPYPLAVIEAAFAGLPLLLSDRVGCHPEALLHGENGLLFDPHDLGSIQSCLGCFSELGPSRWEEMGRRSLELAEERFSTERVVTRFVGELLRL